MNTIISSIVTKTHGTHEPAILIEVAGADGSRRQFRRCFENRAIAPRMMTLLSGAEITEDELSDWTAAVSSGDMEIADDASCTTASRDRALLMEMSDNEEAEGEALYNDGR